MAIRSMTTKSAKMVVSTCVPNAVDKTPGGSIPSPTKRPTATETRAMAQLTCLFPIISKPQVL